MKPVIPILLFTLVAASCSTAYKSGQTPDDVYYSAAPARAAVASTGNDEYIQQRQSRQEQRSYRSNRNNQYNDYNDGYAYDDDRYLRMKVRNRDRWSYLDSYYNDPFAFNYNYNGFGTYNRFYGSNYWSPYTYWNSYSNWNYQYNPYYQPYGHVIGVNPQSPVYRRPRTTNLGAYNRGTSPAYAQPRRSTNTRYQTFDNRQFNQSNASNSGTEMRRSYGNGNNSSSNNTVTPSRPAPSSSGSSGSSGGSRPAPVRKF